MARYLNIISTIHFINSRCCKNFITIIIINNLILFLDNSFLNEIYNYDHHIIHWSYTTIPNVPAISISSIFSHERAPPTTPLPRPDCSSLHLTRLNIYTRFTFALIAITCNIQLITYDNWMIRKYGDFRLLFINCLFYISIWTPNHAIIFYFT